MPKTIRVDRGTETDIMATMHVALHDALGTHATTEEIIDKCVRHGPSTANKIQRFWKDLHERMEKFVKCQLKSLEDSGEYDSTNEEDR